jgi:hypothetical protein
MELFKSPSKHMMTVSASKPSINPSRNKFDPSDLGSLINSPTVNLYKTSVKIKGGNFAKSNRMNN